MTLLQARFDGVSVLNVQTRRDEAAGYLRLVDQVAGIPFRVWSPTLVFRILVILLVILAVGLTIAVVYNDPAYMSAHPDEFGIKLHAGERVTRGGLVVGLFGVYGFLLLALAAFLAIVTLIANGLCAVWPKIFRGHALGFGEDGFMKNWLVEISASTDPPGAERRLHDELLDVTGRGLRHSLLYQDQRVLAAVADWMSASLKEAG